MDASCTLFRPIATIFTDFPDKFGVPRQSGRVPSLSDLRYTRSRGRVALSAAFRARLVRMQ